MSAPYSMDDALFDAEQQGRSLCRRHGGRVDCRCCRVCGGPARGGLDWTVDHQAWCSERELTEEQAGRRIEVWFEGAEERLVCFLDDFVWENELSPLDYREILALEPGQHYHGGGGAFASFTVDRLS